MHRFTTQFALGALVALAAASTPSLADETAASQSTVSADALRVVRDKTTGKLRAPNADELKAMEARERAERKASGLPEVKDAAPVVRVHANGMRSARLGPEYLMSLQGKRSADGSVQRFHSQPAQDHPVARDERPTE